MNLDDELTLTRIKLAARLESNVQNALARIQAPTSGEMREAIEALPEAFKRISDAFTDMGASIQSALKGFHNLLEPDAGGYSETD